jgi:predicted helicase
MTTQEYIKKINEIYLSKQATEHTYRPALQEIIESLVPTVNATNEPKRQQGIAPDYIITKKQKLLKEKQTLITVGYIEAKDIGDGDLLGKNKNGNKEQFDKYKELLFSAPLMFTDYLTFHIFRQGKLEASITIAEVTSNGIKPLTNNFEQFENLMKDFCTLVGQTIRSSKELAKMMAEKARLLSYQIEKSLLSDEGNREDSTLKDQMLGFKKVLIDTITEKEFADVYAQTIAYGMFTARLHDPTLPTFSRQEAAELIPHSNPFLRRLFGYIAGPELDDRIKWIVDSLVEIFLASNVEQLLKDYGKKTKMEDPIIHFYEDFLSEYDPKLRKARGVWYTPQPVVNFIVRAVDDILKSEFGISAGLADKSMITKRINNVETEFHKVQILDPATGTGTFLAETIKHIYKKFANQQGIWSNYVEQHLIPRLNGFEILMASYAMAHLKLDLLLKETGFKPTRDDERFNVFLTNSLELKNESTESLFSTWLSDEANQANSIKRDTPVMCIIGNPPYSGNSANKKMDILDDYKLEPGGKEKLKERNPKMINDDYVKFIRNSQHYIEKNGTGILAFINPHGFLDNPTFRGMRWNLLKAFDKIYTIDLHGNTRRNEISPDGSVDENVFDIMQGVSINLFVKTGEKDVHELGKVFHSELFGKRLTKYMFLEKENIKSINFYEIRNVSPMYFYIPKNYDIEKTFNYGFKLNSIFDLVSSGITTSNDDLLSDFNLKDLKDKLFINNIFDVVEKDFQTVSYKPFDNRIFCLNSKYSMRSRFNLVKHFSKENYSINLRKTAENSEGWCHAFLTILPVEGNFLSARSFSIPLYLYPETKGQEQMEENVGRTPNLNLEMVQQIAEGMGLRFTNEKETTEGTFAPIDLLDYIYAVLHSPAYRERYKEFLKIDFPRVPYPKDVNTFWQLVELGSQIRQLHLLESPILEENIIGYPVDGDNTVTKPYYIDKKVYINETQYFDGVPQLAWEFFIGGYQPAQKWLKDRKNRTLDFDDIFHYQKIIIALTETHRLMQQIDNISFME